MTEQLNEQQMTAWVQAQFQKANQFLAQEGILFDSVITDQSRYLAPYLAVWKIKAMDQKVYWVISGDLPTDVTLAENAAAARDVLRYFSMQWQLKAENLELNNTQKDASQAEFVELLRNRADSLYALYQNEKLWG